MTTNTFYRSICTILLLLICSTTFALAQSDGRKNTFHFNLTNPSIFGGKAYVLGYERVVVKLGETYYQPVKENGKDMYEVANVEDDK